MVEASPRRPTHSDSLRARLQTIALGLPPFVAALWMGGFFWSAVVTVLAFLGLWEWRGLLGARRIHTGERPSWIWTVAGVLWIAGGLLHWVLLRESPDGLLWTCAAVGATWASDAGAYCVGRWVRGPRLAPKISPGKTVSGSIGGLAASTFFLGLAGPAWLGLSGVTAGGFGFLLAAAGQAGDLLESACKRWAGVKDSGTLLPGHGGVLDRFDSLLLAIPVAYYVRPFLI